MAGEVVDYLIGMVITGIVAVSAIVVVPNMSYVSLLSVSQQQLRNVAMDTLKTMLLDAGYPYKWGSLQNFSNSSLQRFGLALDSSDSFYVLDPNKVSRLILDNPAGHLGYDTIRDRLKLQGYGFNFRIAAPFKVTINDGQPVDVARMRNGVSVVVSYNDGAPIGNADVKAKILYIKTQTAEQYHWSTPPITRTDALGRCTIAVTDSDFQSNVEDFVAIFCVTVAGVSTVTATYMSGFHQQTAQASIVGDTVQLWIPADAIPGEQPRGVRRIMSVMAVTETDVYELYVGGNPPRDDMTWGEGYAFWIRQFPELNFEDVLFLVFNIRVSVAGGIGLTYVLFLAPRPNWLGARIEAYGDVTGTRGASTAVKVQRDVVISGMIYTAELTMWKESP